MNRKPIFDAIRYEQNRSISTGQIVRINGLLTALGFPNDSSTPPNTPFIPSPNSAPGQLRREVIFQTLRAELHSAGKYLPSSHIRNWDDALTEFGFPTPPIVDPTIAAKTTVANPSSPKAPLKTLAATLGASAALALTLLLNTWEGNKLVPYYDIVGVATNCRGNTHNVNMSHVYTPEECNVINDREALAHSEPILTLSPELKPQTYPNQFAAVASLTYNIGQTGYAKSSIRTLFRQGHWRSACNRFLAYNRAGGKPVKGLTNRRTAEQKLCLTNLPAQYNS